LGANVQDPVAKDFFTPWALKVTDGFSRAVPIIVPVIVVLSLVPLMMRKWAGRLIDRAAQR